MTPVLWRRSGLWTAVGLLLAVLAAVIAVRSWMRERSLELGRAAAARGDLLGGAERYRTALACGSGAAAVELARIALWRRDWEAAGSFIRDASRLDPARGATRIVEASLREGRPGPWDRAREDAVLEAAQRAIDLNPGDPRLRRAYGDFALALSLRGRDTRERSRSVELWDEAVGAYRTALRQDPAGAPVLMRGLLDRSEDPGLLVEIAAGTRDAVLLAATVELLVDRKRWAETAERYWAAAEVAGELPVFSRAAVAALTKKRRRAEAEEADRRGREVRPNRAGTR